MTKPPGLLKRLMAISYDGLFVLAMMMLALLPSPLIDEQTRMSAWGVAGLRAYLLLIWLSYVGYFWCKRGSTPGMWIWRLSVVDANGQKPALKQVLLHCMIACISAGCGMLGYLWLYLGGLTWHERLSGIRVRHAWLLEERPHQLLHEAGRGERARIQK